MKNKGDEDLENNDDFSDDSDIVIEDGDFESSVDASGPEVGKGKGSKFAIIVVSALMISVVLYFLFFNANENKKENDELDLVTTESDFTSDVPAAAEELEDFDSLFNDQSTATDDSTNEDVILQTPDIPSVPELPDIFEDEPEDSVLPAFLDLPQEKKPKNNLPFLNDDQRQQRNNNPALLGLSNAELPNIPDLPIDSKDIVDGLLLPDSRSNLIPPGQSGVLPAGPTANPNADQTNPQTNETTPASIIVVAGDPGPANSVGYENNIINLNKNPIESLEESPPQVTSQYIKDRSTTLIQGKIITAVLETAINTEFPGEVRGVISRDVFAESGNNILIPRGSRIYGTYSSEVTRGQARVTINWTRLIRPDGVDASVSFNASDQFGRAGIEGDVDNKYGSIITNSILTSVLAVGGAIAADKLSDSGNTTTTTNASEGTSTTTGSASSQAITDVSKVIIDTVGEIVGNSINVDPVIRVPQGTKITIVVNSDMSLPQFRK